MIEPSKLQLWMYILDHNKNVIPTKDPLMAEAFLQGTDRIVKQTYVREKLISTVFLPIDHDFLWDIKHPRNPKPNPSPLVFETMIFAAPHFGQEEYCERYSTYKEALKGHRNTVRMVIQQLRKKQHDRN